jgi:thiol-disulfide isomerase/thioredoxin
MVHHSARAVRDQHRHHRPGRFAGIVTIFIMTGVVPGPFVRVSPAADTPSPSEMRRGNVEERRAEAVEMFLAILRGSRMEAGEGWFHPGRTRYDWNRLATACDTNRDGWVTSKEFAGPADLFNRLDRNENGLIAAEDLDWSDPPPLFDASLELPRSWWDRLRRAPDEPSLGVLLSCFFKGDLGSFREGPGLGQLAPDFTLPVEGGRERVSLSQHRGKRPVVLIFGNMTCGPFRSQMGTLESLSRRYGDRAAFMVVYVREAHPTDGWRMPSNDRAGIALAQPRESAERTAAATLCSRTLKMTMPLLTDELDNRVGHAYSGMPTRLYIIDREGRVAYKSGRGPFGLKPGEMEQSLAMLLRDEAAADSRQRATALQPSPTRDQSDRGTAPAGAHLTPPTEGLTAGK